MSLLLLLPLLLFVGVVVVVVVIVVAVAVVVVVVVVVVAVRPITETSPSASLKLPYIHGSHRYSAKGPAVMRFGCHDFRPLKRQVCSRRTPSFGGGVEPVRSSLLTNSCVSPKVSLRTERLPAPG